MKKMLVFAAFLTTLLFCSSTIFAQVTEAGDTLIVGPLNSEGQPLGALNEAIKGDTTAAGERAHSVYKLLPNAQYILTEVIQADFPLKIVADKVSGGDRPPVVRCGLNADGSAVNLWWRLFDDAHFKNLWISGINLDGTGPINWISQEMNNQGNTVFYEGCIVEFPYTWWAMWADWGSMNKYKTKDCIFMNVGNPTGTTWNGAIMNGGTIDTVIHQNTTFFNFGCFATNGTTFYVEVDHCTFVNSVVHPVESHNDVIRKYTNNLFVNGHAFSDDEAEIKRHYDQEVKGLMNYAEIQWDPQALDSLFGPGGIYGKTYDPNGDGALTEDETVWELKNNNWFYTQPIVDYWNNWDDVTPNPWMNNYNQAMFTNQSGTWTWEVWTYERDTADVIIDSSLVTETHEPFRFFVEENTMNMDPGLVDINGTDVLLAQNCNNIRTEWAGGTVDPVKWHNVSDYLDFVTRYPIDFDLSYTNTTLQTAAEGGFPVGDLNWFPDKYAEWLLTDVEDVTAGEALPTEFSLSQNYPNPFNPTTVIEFSVPLKEHVSLEVFNTIGQRVGKLVSKELNAGNYKYDFDASNLSSGVYFYKLKVGNSFVQTKKMLLMK
jgi:hypothetical protein